jgi:hypothetical protein
MCEVAAILVIGYVAAWVTVKFVRGINWLRNYKDDD